MKINPTEACLLGADFFLLLASMFAFIQFMIFRAYRNKTKQLCGSAEGKIEEIVRGWSQGLGGHSTDRLPVYSYVVNQHSYVVKPYVLDKNCELNRNYREKDRCTCVTYFGPHGGTCQTKYVAGERLRIIYNLAYPEKHLILDDKDRKDFAVGFRKAAILFFTAAGFLALLSLSLWLVL